MRVAALSPQFIFEAPVETEGAAERVSAGIEDRTTSVGTIAQDHELDRSIDEQTREAIRRLSQFVRKQKDDDSKRDTKEKPAVDDEQQLGDDITAGPSGARSETIFVYLTHEQRAILTYRYAMTAGTDDETRGLRLAVVV